MSDSNTPPPLPEPFAALLEMMVAGDRIEAMEAFGRAAERMGPTAYMDITRAFAAEMEKRGIDPEAVEAFTEYAELWVLLECMGPWVRGHHHLSAALH